MSGLMQSLGPQSFLDQSQAASPQQVQQAIRQALPGAGQAQQPPPATQEESLLSILQSFLPKPKPQVDASPEALAKQFEAYRR